MRCVVIESPYAGKDDIEVERNIRYLRACLRDSLMRGEAPYASHGLYTQPGVLDDSDPEQRRLGMDAGFDIGDRLDAVVAYTDFGVTGGMFESLDRRPQWYPEERQLDPDVVNEIKQWEQQARYRRRFNWEMNELASRELTDADIEDPESIPWTTPIRLKKGEFVAVRDDKIVARSVDGFKWEKEDGDDDE
jgi:hypothetical protein